MLYHLLPPEIGLKYREVSRHGILILLAILLFFRQLLSILLLPTYYALTWAAEIIRPFSLGSLGNF